jgi:hypothetical protein
MGHISIPGADAAGRKHSSFWRKWTASFGGLDELRRGNLGIYVEDDFFNFDVDGTVATQFAGDAGQYQGYLDTGATIASVESDYGMVRLATDTTDDDECVLRYGGDTVSLGAISDAAGEKAVTLFEARVKTDAIADGTAGLQIGMAQAGVGDAADELTDATADIADIDFIGFKADEDDGDKFDTVHRINGGAETIVQADAVTLVAATWKKIGFAYVPDHPDGARVIFYDDGAELSTIVSAATFAATFPDAQYLTTVFGIRNDAGSTAKQLDVDWWAFGQLQVG